jgi:DUF1365 family protein
MVIHPQLYTAKIMHKRFFPRENSFNYNVYYLVLPLPALPISSWLVGFHMKDVGKRDGTDPTIWVRSILTEYGLDQKTQNILLVTMPRILGYVFNPVSFYLCLDNKKALRAVLCEVHNTFGEQHSYLCANPDHSPIKPDQWLESEKVFHVSPFLDREGNYKFRFSLKGEQLSIWIDYYDKYKKKKLITSLIGNLKLLTKKSLRKAFWQHPLVTMKAIILIHLQASRLFFKGIRHLTKPPQLQQKITGTRNLNKM